MAFLSLIAFGVFCRQKPFSYILSTKAPCYLYAFGILCGHIDIHFLILSFGDSKHALGFHIEMLLTSQTYFTFRGKYTRIKKAVRKARQQPLAVFSLWRKSTDSTSAGTAGCMAKGHKQQPLAFIIPATLCEVKSCRGTCHICQYSGSRSPRERSIQSK